MQPIEPAAPVGTTYQRVNPLQEINSQERDKFWKKEEEEEKKRLEEENSRKKAELYKHELEISQRENILTRQNGDQTLTRNCSTEGVKLNQSNDNQTHEKSFVSKTMPRPEIG